MKWGKLTAGLAILSLVPGCEDVPQAVAANDVSAPVAAASAKPDPAGCPPPEYEYDEDEFGPRGDPLAVPGSIANVAATDNINLAVTTLDGGQICKDMSWAYNLSETAQAHLDGRFIAIGWGAYEAFGTLMFDRAGKGAVVETGNMPSFSPSGKRVAALQFTQSGFGGLENMMIWEVVSDGLKDLFSLPEGTYLNWIEQGYNDLEVESWQGESCLQIVAFADADLEVVEWDRAKAKRTPFHAAEANKWEIKRGRCP